MKDSIVNYDIVARAIAERSGLSLKVVNRVLDLELEYLMEIGIAYKEGDDDGIGASCRC